mmetsp:Transcript_27657/g.67288  ORF Transcript_27657/g.67288 Transcript_27657/m.67288 type:complete len:215 (-) Transcript_27657:477-1121(-)
MRSGMFLASSQGTASTSSTRLEPATSTGRRWERRQRQRGPGTKAVMVVTLPERRSEGMGARKRRTEGHERKARVVTTAAALPDSDACIAMPSPTYADGSRTSSLPSPNSPYLVSPPLAPPGPPPPPQPHILARLFVFHSGGLPPGLVEWCGEPPMPHGYSGDCERYAPSAFSSPDVWSPCTFTTTPEVPRGPYCGPMRWYTAPNLAACERSAGS